MKCSRTLSLLPLHSGGDLDEVQAAEVDRHVRTCESCAAELAAYEASRQSLFALKGETPPPAPDLWPSVRLRAGPPPRIRRWRPVRAAAAALLVAAIGTFAYWVSGPAGTPAGHPEKIPLTPPVAEAGAPGTPRSEEFVLAEVGPTMGDPEHSFAAGELPFVVPAEPERTDWDEF